MEYTQTNHPKFLNKLLMLTKTVAQVKLWIVLFALLLTAPAWAQNGNWSDYKALAFSNASGTTINIISPAELALLAYKVTSEGVNYSGYTINLTTNLDMGAHYWDKPIGLYDETHDNTFMGTFDGGNHTISGIYTSNSTSNYQGLFGFVGRSFSYDDPGVPSQSGTVRNLTLATSTITGKENVGGIAAYLWNGMISNCHVLSSVSIQAGSSNSKYHGGIVGQINPGQISQSNSNYNSATVQNCTCGASITSGSYSGCSDYGGIVGSYNRNTSTLTGCLYNGTSISANSNKGAIIGSCTTTSGISNCYYYYSSTINGIGSGGSVGSVKQVYKLTLGTSDLTISSSPTYTFNGTNYYATGAVTTISNTQYITALTATSGSINNVTYSNDKRTAYFGFGSDATVTATFATGGLCGANAWWDLSEDGTVLTISGSGAMYDYGYTTVNSLWRTNAPWGWQNITSVTIGDGVTSIGNYAFIGAQNLASVTIGNSVASIGIGAINHCDEMTTITLPASVNTIGYAAFENCQALTTIYINNTGAVSLTGSNNNHFNAPNLEHIVFSTPSGALANTTGHWTHYAEKCCVQFGSQFFLATNEGGTPAYKIATEQDLRNLATAVNAGNNGSGKTFRQTADITMSNTTFTPIATGNYEFCGTYDGGGYVIIGLNAYYQYYSGLFGRINEATVKDVNLINPTITGTGGSMHLGAVVAWAGPNCHITVSNCHYYGSNNYAVVNYNNSGNTVTNCNRAFLLTIGEGITTSTVPAFSYNGTNYYGGTITLPAAPAGYVYNYTVNGSTINGNTFTISEDATVARTTAPDPTHFSQSGNEYTIHTANGWEVFCDLLQNNPKGYFTGKTVQLDADIEVSRMAGISQHDFTGTFNGQGNTLTFTYNNPTEAYAAPFRYVEGTSETVRAAIQNLNVVSTVSGTNCRHLSGLVGLSGSHVDVSNCNVEVHISSTKTTDNDMYPSGLMSQCTGPVTISGCTVTGEIATNGKYAAGILAVVQGSATIATITNCVSSVTINSSTAGDGTHGGFVGLVSNGSTSIEGCLFNGKLLTVGETATGNCGGFIGWGANIVSLSNCLYAPASLASGESEVAAGSGNNPSRTFGRDAVGSITNCYFTRALGTEQGKQPRSITAGENVTVAHSGTATEYTTSGITAYKDGNTQLLGLKYGDVLYAGENDQVSLTLNHSEAPTGYTFTGYEASNGGTITGTSNPYTLTLPNEDVTVSTTLTPNTYYVSFDANGGNGSMDDMEFTYNEEQALTANTFTRSGYTFIGWSLTPNPSPSGEGRENLIADGASVSNLTTNNNVTVTLYAQWTANTYYVSFVANGGNGSMDYQTFHYDEAQPLSPNTFTRTGYTFIGWSLTANENDNENENNSTIFTDGQSVSNLTDEDGGNVILYAQWLVHVPYLDANGNTQTCTNYTLFTGDETSLSGWYVVDGFFYIYRTLTLEGDVHLVLKDNADLNLSGDDNGIYDEDGSSLNIYAQSTGSSAGTLTVQTDYNNGNAINTGGDVTINGGNILFVGGTYGINNGNDVTINGGHVEIAGSYSDGINAYNVTINGGYVEVSGDQKGINAYLVTINGGQVRVSGDIYGIWGNNFILGWTNVSDYIYASSYYNENSIGIASGKTFVDDDNNIYSGTIDYDDETWSYAIDGKTLSPAVEVTLPCGLTPGSGIISLTPDPSPAGEGGNENHYYAKVGQTVTVAVPTTGCTLGSITVTSNTVVLNDNGDGTYSFTVPAEDVTVSGGDQTAPVHSDNYIWRDGTLYQDACLACFNMDLFLPQDTDLFVDCSPMTITHTDTRTGNDRDGWTIRRYYEVTDACGNTILDSIVVSGRDSTPPAANNPMVKKDTLWADHVQCLCDSIHVINDFDELVTLFALSDECTGDDISLVSKTRTFKTGDHCADTVVVAYTVADLYGHAKTFYHAQLIQDTIGPTFRIVPSQDTTLCVDPDGDYEATVDRIAALVNITDIQDNCTRLQENITVSDPTINYAPSENDNDGGYITADNGIRTYFKVWTVTDSCGNTTRDKLGIHLYPLATIRIDSLYNQTITYGENIKDVQVHHQYSTLELHPQNSDGIELHNFVDNIGTLRGMPDESGSFIYTLTATSTHECNSVDANVSITVNSRPITITAASAIKKYDGTPLTSNNYICTLTPPFTDINNRILVNDDSIASVTITGSQTNVGTSQNVPSEARITITTEPTADKSPSYAISYGNGTLEVIENDTLIRVIPGSGSKVYDGTPFTMTAHDDFTVTGVPEGLTWTATADGTVTNVIPGDGEKAVNAVTSFRIFDFNNVDVTNYFTNIDISATGTLRVIPSNDVAAGTWQAISTPTHDNNNPSQLSLDNVENLTTSAYDLLRFNEETSTWENQKVHADFTSLAVGRGYIYRSSTATTLTFNGAPNVEASYSVALTASGTTDLKGFNLVGNPYPFSIKFEIPFYSLGADGHWTAHDENESIAMGQAVLVHTSQEVVLIFEAAGRRAYLSDPEAKGSLPPLPKGLCLSGDCQDDSEPSVLNNQFAHWDGNRLTIEGSGTLQVFDILGRKLLSKEISTTNSHISSLCFPSAGVYILRLGNQSQKIVVK